MSAFNRKVLSRTSLFIGVWFLILVPTSASTLLVVEYVNQGYTTTQSVAITNIGSMGYVVGACLSIMIADKFERKYQFVVAGLIMGIAFILRGLFIQDYAPARRGWFHWLCIKFMAQCLSLYLYRREFSYSYTIDSFRSSRRTRECPCRTGSNSFCSASTCFLNVMMSLASFLFVAAARSYSLGVAT